MRNERNTIWKIVRTLNDAESNGGLWLPNIQRPFVWSEAQIERLFDSIMREYPISTLLVWRTREPIKHRRFISDWKDSLKVSDAYVMENKEAKGMVLDGQQRLQSLIIGFYSYSDGSMRNQYDVAQFRRGQPLLTLTRSGRGLRTTWQGISPGNDQPSRYPHFRKVR